NPKRLPAAMAWRIATWPKASGGGLRMHYLYSQPMLAVKIVDVRAPPPVPSALRARVRRAAGVEVPAPPFHFFVVAMHRVPRRPAAVVRVGVADHARRNLQLPQRQIHLLGFLDRHARVRFAVDEQRRCFHLRDVGDRRLLPQHVVRLWIPRRTKELALLRPRN